MFCAGECNSSLEQPMPASFRSGTVQQPNQVARSGEVNGHAVY